MTSWWCESVLLPGGVAQDVRVETDAGRVSGVVVGERPRAGDERLPGVVLPGLANAHSHAFHRALRGRSHDGRGTFWTWRERMYEVVAGLTPESYRDLARATYAEMVLSGWTAVGEFHYVHHDVGGSAYIDPNAMGHAVVDAARDAGIRLTLLDVCYLHGGLKDGAHLPLDATQRRFSDGSVAAWADRLGRLTGELASGSDPRDPVAPVVGAAAHSVRALSREELAELARHAGAGMRWPVLHLHLSEQPAENLEVERRYGLTPTALARETGILGEGTTAVHATHLTQADLAALGESRTGVCFCPTTERDLADGCGPARELLDAGARLSLGTDQHAVVDPFEEMRGLEMDERLRTGRRGRLGPDELVVAGTVDGFAALGRPGDGRVEVGASADLVAVDACSVRTAGARPEQLMYAATSADVTDVVVAGEPVVRHRRHRLGDVARLLVEAIDVVDEIARTAGHDEEGR